MPSDAAQPEQQYRQKNDYEKRHRWQRGTSSPVPSDLPGQKGKELRVVCFIDVHRCQVHQAETASRLTTLMQMPAHLLRSLRPEGKWQAKMLFGLPLPARQTVLKQIAQRDFSDTLRESI